MKRNSNHIIEPLYNINSKILILSSFPSVKSMEKGFYYMHPQNRFYKVLSRILDQDVYIADIENKKRILLENKIALYDSIESCEMNGSDDSSIKNVIPTDIKLILENSNIEKIFLNGKKSYEYFSKYHSDLLDMAICLPSTSAANAKWNLDKLVDDWMIIKKYM